MSAQIIIDAIESTRNAIAAIEREFAALPGATPQLVSGIGRDIFIAAGNAPMDASAADIKALKKQIADLSAGAKLLTASAKSPTPSKDMMFLLPAEWRVCLSSLAALEVPVLSPGRGRGKPNNTRAARVTKRAGWHYERVTGKRPTVSNPSGNSKATGRFLNLLGAVFDALGLDASAEGQAKAFIASRRKNNR